MLKEKIFQAIKTLIVNPTTGKTSISDETINAYVDILALSVTDEAAIAEAIKPFVVALKTTEGNINLIAAEAVKNIKPVEKPLPKPLEKPTDTPLTLEAINALLDQRLNPALEKITGFETQSKAEKRQIEVAAKAKEYGVPENFASRFAIAEDANLDDYFKGVKQEFTNIGFDGTQAPDTGSAVNKDSNALADLIQKETKTIVESKK